MFYCSPLRSILMHGFTVDETGQKMSKSLGNVIAPSDIIYGNKQVLGQLIPNYFDRLAAPGNLH